MKKRNDWLGNGEKPQSYVVGGINKQTGFAGLLLRLADKARLKTIIIKDNG